MGWSWPASYIYTIGVHIGVQLHYRFTIEDYCKKLKNLNIYYKECTPQLQRNIVLQLPFGEEQVWPLRNFISLAMTDIFKIQNFQVQN